MMKKTGETTDPTKSQVGGGLGAAGRGTRAHRARVGLIAAIALMVVAALVSSQVTVFVVQPIGALPEGRTVVMSRLATTKFIDSADAICLRIQDGVSLLCRGMGAYATREISVGISGQFHNTTLPIYVGAAKPHKVILPLQGGDILCLTKHSCER